LAQEQTRGRRGHVGAVAELQAVSDEVMRAWVEMLGWGLNRYRLGGETWSCSPGGGRGAARNVVGGGARAADRGAGAARREM